MKKVLAILLFTLFASVVSGLACIFHTDLLYYKECMRVIGNNNTCVEWVRMVHKGGDIP